ncbi:Lrp/AsnC family transcriptional regulator [Rhodanobacter aciditrophus]|uniref:Lrp/AsnC family transcriptional regulator n=1 Tax=Rhodanobacter aciditrophus TaxID=1623218 RepID=A0ABW4AZR0_9GAMM
MRSNLKNEVRALDGIDAKLVSLLNENARMSIAELGRAVNMSSPSVNERLKRLEEAGIISGYTVTLDPEQIGYTLQAIVRMRQLPGKLKELEELIQSIPQFIECDRVTGEDCFYARLCLTDIHQLDEILNRVCEIAETNTSIVKSTPVKRRQAPLLVGGS